MGKKSFIKKDFSGLVKLRQELSKSFEARVGILGTNSSNSREDKSFLTNSDIGFKHEFGSRSENIPKRSFLREPMMEKLNDDVIKKRLKLKKIIESLDMKSFFVTLGIIGESVVQRAFSTRGFGKWPPNSPATIARKKSDSPLIDTAQLRKSITSDVKEK